MICTGCPPCTELEYVHALTRRRAGACCGPLVTLPLVTSRLERLESGLKSESGSQLLWDALVHAGDGDRMLFRLCAVHWMELCHLLTIHAHLDARRDWFGEASTLVRQICQGAGWDPKEIANMMAWQRVTLT